MISIRTKCLFVGAAIAPISLLSIFELSLRTARSIQSQEINPQEAARLAQTMPPYGPILMKLFIAGSFFSLAALVSLIFDKKQKSTQQ
jgi:hypothetical protein